VSRTVAQIESEIARLEKKRDALRAQEVSGVIARIREAIDYYGLTAADLGFGRRGLAAAGSKSSARTRKRKGPGSKRQAGAIRFRDEHGNKWTGHGRQPAWFKEAIAAGKSREDLAVK